jgi:hypothetical protein
MFIIYINILYSDVDRHRFDADPDPTFHFDADPDPDRTLRFIQKNGTFFTFIHSIVSLHNFMFLISDIGNKICNMLIFSEKSIVYLYFKGIVAPD